MSWKQVTGLWMLAGCSGLAKPVFEEKHGIVVMEAESTGSRLGSWKKKTDVAGYEGECHLEFTGNQTTSGPPKSPLKYEFTISKEGNYTLTLRARKRLESKRADISNDCYVALKGDFESGGEAPLKTLKDDTKMFGGDADDWGWANSLDANHKKFPPVYKLKSGETYELTIHGRSKNFNIDRIILFHESHDRRAVQKKKLDESKTADESVASKQQRVRRRLTDKNGRVVDAQLVEVDGSTVVVIINNRRHRIEAETLSEKDQQFISKWWAGEWSARWPQEYPVSLEIVSMILAFVVALLVGRPLFGMLFDDSSDFWDCVISSLTPDLISLFRGEYWHDFAQSMKLGLFFFLSVGSGVLVYSGVTELIGSLVGPG
jgi:hypothetical protein